MAKKNGKIAQVRAWVLETLEKNGPMGNMELVKEAAKAFPDINYDTVRAGVYYTGKLPCVGRTDKRKWVLVSKPVEGEKPAPVKAKTKASPPPAPAVSVDHVA